LVLCKSCLESRNKRSNGFAYIAYDGNISMAVLADFSRIDICMKNLGVDCKGRKLSGDAVIKARA
jgi:hypothetical protein